MKAFHTLWTRPFFARHPDEEFLLEPAELLTTALSALLWRKTNGSISMVTDSVGQDYWKSLGLSFLWDGGVTTVLDDMPRGIDPIVYWAAGKLFALQHTHAPCVMLDTDFIVWQPLDLSGCACAAIHAEELLPSVYPNPHTLRADFDFSAFDFTVHPVNTALSYFGDDAFRNLYVATALNFMLHTPAADDALTYMVFAEQRLLSMLAVQEGIGMKLLSDLPTLFGSEQQRFTHIWGAKQQLRDDPGANAAFCRRCALRLTREYPEAAAILREIPSLTAYFSDNKRRT